MIADVAANPSTEAHASERASDGAPPADPAMFAGILRKAQDEVALRASQPLARMLVPTTVAEQPGTAPEGLDAAAPIDVDDTETFDESPVRAGKKRERVPGTPLVPVWSPLPLPQLAPSMVQSPRPDVHAMAAPREELAGAGEVDMGPRTGMPDGLNAEAQTPADDSAQAEGANPSDVLGRLAGAHEESRSGEPALERPTVATANPNTTQPVRARAQQARNKQSAPPASGVASAPDAPVATSSRLEPEGLASAVVQALPGPETREVQPSAGPRLEQASNSQRSAAQTREPEARASLQEPTREPGLQPPLRPDEVPATPSVLSLRDLTQVVVRVPETAPAGEPSLPKDAMTMDPEGTPIGVPRHAPVALLDGAAAPKSPAEGQDFRGPVPAGAPETRTGTKPAATSTPGGRKREPLDALGHTAIPSAPTLRAHTGAPAAVPVRENQGLGRHGHGDPAISLMTLRHETHVHLRDPELGELRIGGLSRDGAVHVSVRAAEPETAQQLATHSAALAQELRSIPSMGTLSVSHTSSGGQERGSAFGADQGQGREHRPARGDERAGDHEAPRHGSRRRVRIVL